MQADWPDPDARSTHRATYTRARRFGVHPARAAELADDATQEAFRRLLNEQAAGRNPPHRLQWLIRVAWNHIADQFHREDRYQRHEHRLSQRLDRLPGYPAELAAALLAAIERLPETDRTLLARKLQGDSLDVLAEATAAPGDSPNARRLAVFRRLKRIYQQLRQQLADLEPDPAPACER